MSNGSTKMGKFGGSGDMSYQKKESGDVRKENRSQNSSGSRFQTDTAISGNRMAGERTLQRWVPDTPASQDLSLEGGSSANGRPWDQFAVNEQKFGLKTDYDPNIYTTAINKKDSNYQKRVEQADRIAREIEGSTANNSHVAEERVTDNFTGDSGMDEEDKYSGVQRQQDFPPLASANRSNKYTTPARRAPTGQSTVSGAPVDPAIISSQLARPDKLPMEKNRSIPAPAQTSQNADASASRPESPATNATAKPEVKSTAQAPSSTAKAPSSQSAKKIEALSSLVAPTNTASSAAGTAVVPNATATIEHDVNASFKTFAIQQRSQVSQVRVAKAKQDKEVKLNDLKKFSQTFKLHSAVPDDLIPIIAKDPAKQREIADRSRREAEAKNKEKKEPAKVVAPVAPSSDLKNAKPPAPHMGPSANIPNRQNSSRAPGFAPQGPYSGQNRNQQVQMNANQHGRQNNNGAMNPKMRGPDGNKFMPPQVPGMYDPRMSMGPGPRLPPTGPSMQNGDSRRSSGIGGQFTPKLNPNSSEFRPTSFSSNMTSTNNSVAPSPRVGATIAQAPAGPFLRRKPLPASQRPSFIKDSDVLEQMKKNVPANGKDYTHNGGIVQPFETAPVFKSDPDDVSPEKKMVETFTKVFELQAAAILPISPVQSVHATPQVPHQHQLPFHLQQGAHTNRPSPRQQQALHMQHPYPHPQPSHYNNHEDHRMVPSHSAQSFQSPRLGNVGMAYQSPMVQPAPIPYQPQQPGMQYAMGPGGQAPNLNRSYSGNGQFYQGPVMNGQVMMQGPPNGFMGPQGMVGPGQQMPMHGSGPPGYFIPQGAPPPMAGANGYPSPGRGAAMMMTQGSQQGQPPVFGLSPAMSFQQPVPAGQYSQQPPGPMGNMRAGGYGPGPNFGTSPQQQMYQYPQNRGPGNNYNNGNKNFHPQQQGPHTPAQQHQVPTGPQGRPVEGGDETK